jgi:GT2 family glycosyltransferase
MSPLFRGKLRRLRELYRRRRPSVRIERDYTRWLQHERVSAGSPDGPLISVLLPVYNPSPPMLEAAIGSVLAQSFADWELCIVDDASPASGVTAWLAARASQDRRIRVCRLARNGGIAGATNAALGMATGAFVALLDHDDVLAPHALACVAQEIALYPDVDLIFSDEDQLVDGRRCVPYFKPGWNPDLLLGQNLISHLGVYRKTMIERIGGMREGFDGSQDYDLALRSAFGAPQRVVRHVPQVLYHWRQHRRSFSAQRLATCQASARAALADCLGDRADIAPHPELPLWNLVSFHVPQPAPRVSLIVPGGAPAPHDPFYADVELCADLEAARGDVLVFLAAGLSAMRPGWLRELVTQASRPEIGCAGGRLDAPDGLICFSGYTLHPEAIAQTVAPRSDRRDPGYVGHFLLARNVSAVSRDCLAVRRAVFEQEGGFDPLAGAYADVDFCLRLSERGLRCVWTPQARLRHRESPSTLRNDVGASYMQDRWGFELASDPYLNPNLTIENSNLSLHSLST